MNFEDFFNGLTGSIKERLGNKIIGAIFLTLCAWNWQEIYLTLFVDYSTLHGINKLDYIKDKLYGLEFWCPAIIGIVIATVIMPLINYIGLLPEWFLVSYKKLLMSIRKQIPITREEHEKIIEKLTNDAKELRQNYAQAIQEQDANRKEITKLVEDRDEKETATDLTLSELQTKISQLGKAESILRLFNKEYTIDREDLVIFSAIYGTNDLFTDVTNIVRPAVFNNSLSIDVTYNNFGDPAPGSDKELRVTYSKASKSGIAIAKDSTTLKID